MYLFYIPITYKKLRVSLFNKELSLSTFTPPPQKKKDAQKH